MKRLIFILAAIGFIAGCSSKTAKPEPEDVEQSTPAPWDKDPAPPQTLKKRDAPLKADRAATPELAIDPYGELNAAIKAQSDERILASAHEILKHRSNDVRALNALGAVAYKKGRFDLAAYFLDKASQKAPNQSDIYNNLGLVELARKQQLGAIKNFRRAIELNPNNGAAAANLGSIYVAEKDYNKAATVLEIAYRQGPRDVKILSNYGVALAGTKKYDQAQQVYEEAAKLNPNNREVLLNQAILLVENLDRPKDGMDLINRLKFLGPPSESRDRLSSLEIKAKAGLK